MINHLEVFIKNKTGTLAFLATSLTGTIAGAAIGTILLGTEGFIIGGLLGAGISTGCIIMIMKCIGLIFYAVFVFICILKKNRKILSDIKNRYKKSEITTEEYHKLLTQFIKDCNAGNLED